MTEPTSPRDALPLPSPADLLEDDAARDAAPLVLWTNPLAALSGVHRGDLGSTRWAPTFGARVTWIASSNGVVTVLLKPTRLLPTKANQAQRGRCAERHREWGRGDGRQDVRHALHRRSLTGPRGGPLTGASEVPDAR